MTKIPFPKNYERFIALGQEALAAGSFRKAGDFLLQAYEIQPDFPLNFLLLTTFAELGEGETAYVLAQDYLDDYERVPDYLALYIRVLLQTKRFVEAQTLINRKILTSSKQDMKALVILKKEIRRAELLAQQFEHERIAQVKNELEILPERQAHEQLQLIKEAALLPQADFVEIAKELLQQPKLHSLAKSWLLEELQRLEITETIPISWQGKIRQVIPAELGSPGDSASYQRVLLYLEKELVNSDPILLLNIEEEVILHFAMLYPFADEIITNPTSWAKSYIETYQLEATSLGTNEQEEHDIQTARRLQDQLRQVSQESFL